MPLGRGDWASAKSPGRGNQPSPLAFTPDGKGLATSHLKDRNPTSELSGLGESEIRFLDLTTGGVKWAVSSEQVPVFSLAFSPDGRRLASGEWKGRVFLRDAANGQPVRQFDTLYGSTNGVAFAPDGKLLYAVGTLGRIFVWNTVTGESRFPEVSHASGVVDLSLSPDGQTLATAGGDGDKTIRLWDLKSGQTRVILRDPISLSERSSSSATGDGWSAAMGMARCALGRCRRPRTDETDRNR